MSFTDSSAKPNQWRNILLVLSLCINVALVAVLGVGAVRLLAAARAAPFIAQPAGPLAPGQVMRSLTPERRQQLRAIMRSHRPELMRLRQAARTARQDTFRVFAAPSFDNAAFAAALARVSAADSALEEEAVAQARELVAALTPQERQKIIENRQQPRQRPFLRRLLGKN